MVAVELLLDADLRNGHNGLTQILQKQKISLKEKQVAMFVNGPKTGIKAIAWNGVLMYGKFEDGIDLNSFDKFVQAVNGKDAIATITPDVKKQLYAALGIKYQPVKGRTLVRNEARMSA